MLHTNNLIFVCNYLQYHIDHIASVFDEANNILTYTESLMEENTASFEIATQAFSDAELILEGSSTGNLPLGNLTIDLTGIDKILICRFVISSL